MAVCLSVTGKRSTEIQISSFCLSRFGVIVNAVQLDT